MISIKSETIAKVLIISDKNEALVLTLGKHLRFPEKSYLPDLPGGVADPNETEREAAVREVAEECGIDLDEKNLLLVHSETAFYEREAKSVTKLLYIARLDHTPEVNLSWEHSDYRWVPLNELPAVKLRSFLEATAYSVQHGLI